MAFMDDHQSVARHPKAKLCPDKLEKLGTGSVMVSTPVLAHRCKCTDVAVVE